MNENIINVVGVIFKKYGKKYYFDCHDLKVRKNLTVIVETERGLQFGTVVTDIIEMEKDKVHYPLKRVIRISKQILILQRWTFTSAARRACIYPKQSLTRTKKNC